MRAELCEVANERERRRLVRRAAVAGACFGGVREAFDVGQLGVVDGRDGAARRDDVSERSGFFDFIDAAVDPQGQQRLAGRDTALARGLDDDALEVFAVLLPREALLDGAAVRGIE
jgi:hypothetical protein